ncbi:MAG TPA: flagellar hook-associated protein FlgL [Burkholderiaceae bacterium]|jgi:flagellar hook-associated protein 3 FlgL
MNISTANNYNTSLDALVARQTAMTNSQEQLTTGKRVNRASDDPAAAARTERALAAQQRTVADQRGVDAANNAMSLADGAMGDASELLQQAREAMVSVGNASFTDAERKTVANQLIDIRQQLFAVANRTDGAGRYVFGGQDAGKQPFADVPGGVQYQNTTGQNQAASGEPLPLTTDGAAAWMTARTGNGVFTTGPLTSTGDAWIDGGSVTDPSALTGSTYDVQFSVSGATTTYSVLKDGVAMPTLVNIPFTPGQAVQVDGMSATITGAPGNGDAFEITPSSPSLSVFDTLDKAIADLNTPNRSGSKISQTNSTNLGNLDQVLGQMSAARAQVGATLNRVDAVTSRLSALKLSSETEQSNAQDLDMTQAISDFSSQQTGYDAALKAYSLVQKLSLFNYLST